MSDVHQHPSDLTLEGLAELLEADAATLRQGATALSAQADEIENRREQFIADVAKPIQRLREAAGLSPGST